MRSVENNYINVAAEWGFENDADEHNNIATTVLLNDHVPFN